TLTGDELEQVVYHLAHILCPVQESANGTRYCIVASEDPLSVLLCCLAAWRSDFVVVLPNNLRPLTLDQLSTARFATGTDSAPHPRLDDASVDQALSLFKKGGPTKAPAKSHITAAQTAIICFTSGSTGKPEPHQKSARQVLGEAQL